MKRKDLNERHCSDLLTEIKTKSETETHVVLIIMMVSNNVC